MISRSGMKAGGGRSNAVFSETALELKMPLAEDCRVGLCVTASLLSREKDILVLVGEQVQGISVQCAVCPARCQGK